MPQSHKSGLGRRFGPKVETLAWSVRPGVYAGSTFLLGIAFSAVWPAFFALAGVNGCMLAVSRVGNRDARLPAAVLFGAACLLPFAVYLASPWGRALRGRGAETAPPG